MGLKISLTYILFLWTVHAEEINLRGNLIPQKSLYDAATAQSSWDPDIEYSKLSSALQYDSIANSLNPNDGSQIQIAYCNNYAANGGSVLYTPCSANYLVAAHSNGVILPPNLCGGQLCPTAGGSFNPGPADASKCSEFADSITGGPLATETSLFDQYCLASQKCGAQNGDGTFSRPSGPLYPLSPPVFTIATNWCDAATAGRSSIYPTFKQFLNLNPQDTSVSSQQFCPADTGGGYSDTAVYFDFK